MTVSGGWDGGARDSDRQGHSLRGGGHEARSRRHLLLPVLLAVQEHVGWISQHEFAWGKYSH